MADESERESVSKIVAPTVREILGEPEASASVRTLTITDGILGVTHAAKQECDDGTWILADTGATHELVSLRKGQKIPTGTRPCKLQLAIGHVEGWISADGVVYIVSEKELPCRILAACNVSWTLTPTGGDLVGHNGEQFAVVFRGSPSLPFLHKNKLGRLRNHRKRCLRTKAVKSSMWLGELTEKTPVDTSLAEGEIICVAPARVLDSVERHGNVCVDPTQDCGSETVCVAPSRVLNSEEQSDHGRGGHVCKVGNCSLSP